MNNLLQEGEPLKVYRDIKFLPKEALDKIMDESTDINQLAEYYGFDPTAFRQWRWDKRVKAVNRDAEKNLRSGKEVTEEEKKILVKAPHGEVTKVSKSMGIKPSFAHNLRHYLKKSFGVKKKTYLPKELTPQTNDMQEQALVGREMSLSLGNVKINLNLMGQDGVSGVAVDDNAITITIK